MCYLSCGVMLVDALNSQSNLGYLSCDVMAGIIPEKDDCKEALEHCQELVGVYEPAARVDWCWERT